MKMAGGEPISARSKWRQNVLSVPFLVLTIVLCHSASGQTLYKYRGEDGEWMFTDRAPAEGQKAEVRVLRQATKNAKVRVTSEFKGREIVLTAFNDFYAPMELALFFDDIAGVSTRTPMNACAGLCRQRESWS